MLIATLKREQLILMRKAAIATNSNIQIIHVGGSEFEVYGVSGNDYTKLIEAYNKLQQED